jgi:hypothetical protein
MLNSRLTFIPRPRPPSSIGNHSSVGLSALVRQFNLRPAMRSMLAAGRRAVLLMRRNGLR